MKYLLVKPFRLIMALLFVVVKAILAIGGLIFIIVWHLSFKQVPDYWSFCYDGNFYCDSHPFTEDAYCYKTMLDFINAKKTFL